MSLSYIMDYKAQNKKIIDSAIGAAKNVFPVDGVKHKMVMDRIWAEENKDIRDIKQQKDIKLKGGSWTIPVYAHLKLIDKETGKVIDETKRKKLFNVPRTTSRLSSIIDGNEYQTVNQLRRRSGVYNLIKSNGAIESQFNMAKGSNFKLKFNQDTGALYINLGTTNIFLYPVLKDLGVTDVEIINKWGQEVVDINNKASKRVSNKELISLAQKLTRKEYENKEDAKAGLLEYFGTTDLGGGQALKAKDMLDSSTKLLEIAKGKTKPDDMDSFEAKEINSIEDFIEERITKSSKKTLAEIKRNLDKRSSINEMISTSTFGSPIKTLYTTTSLATTTEQTNPLDMISRALDVTLMGEGGITSDAVITNAARALHPTHLGFVDPLMTPESGKVGVTTQMALNSVKLDKEFKTAVYDLSTNPPELRQITPAEFKKNKVAFADEYKRGPGGKFMPKGKKIKVSFKGEIIQVRPPNVDMIMASTKGMFSLVSNLVPFMNADSGSRLLMADKHITQAVMLTNREAPLVQTRIASEGPTFHRALGKVLSQVSKVDGEVIKVTGDTIVLKDGKGKKHEHQIYENFPLNQKTYMHDTPTVKVGDKIKEGDTIAESNYVKDGDLALGTNLLVGYIPIKGHSFEDSQVISEGAAKKLTSSHMHKETVRLNDETVMSKKKYNAHFPGNINIAESAKLDEEGVVKKGQIVEMGSTIAAVLVKNVVDSSSSLKRLSRSMVKPYRDSAITWHYDFMGVVTDVIKSPKQITVYIKSEEPAVIGDKLSGVHGNKGTIGLIIPDNEMPRTVDGRVLDIALNPHGVPSRMNDGQMLETQAGKIAEAINAIYKIENFTEDDLSEKLKDDAKKHGVSLTEDLIDPETGQRINDIMVGKQYVLKLNHPARKKFQSRSYGEGYSKEDSPGRGGEKGGQSIDALAVHAMLSHGSKALLRETHSIKSGKNDEYWRAVQMGQQPPPPKTSHMYDKFVALLKGSGINVDKNGSKVQISPMSNEEILKMSNGEIKNIGVVRGKNLKEEKGGLFDPTITGGLDGTKFSHIALSEEIPNPVYENAIKAILKLADGESIKTKQYEGIINGEIFVDKKGKIVDDPDDGETGGKVISNLLGKINVKKRIGILENDLLPNAKKSARNKLNKEYRYLKALDRLGKDTNTYMLKNIPVVPPIYRPIYSLPDGNTTVSSLVHLYKDVKAVSDQLGDSVLMEEDKQNLRKDLNQTVKALMGLGESVTNPNLKGTLAEIKGDQPKTGLFQAKLLKRRNDLTGRTVVIPSPGLSSDEIELPEKMAWKIFKPFVVRKLVQVGYTPLQALKNIEDETKVAKSVLGKVLEERPVILNRAPTLHRFGAMAFKPKLKKGKAIGAPALVSNGFNLDHDGDQQLAKVVVSIDKSSLIEYYSLYPLIFNKENNMTARFKETVPFRKDGEIFIVDLEEFPREGLISKSNTEKGPIEFYRAPSGVFVLANNESNAIAEWKEVSGWSVHKDRIVEIVNLKSKRQIITDDDPRAVYGVNAGSLKYTRNTPTVALENKMLVPRVVGIDAIDENDVLTSIPTIKYSNSHHCAKNMIPSIALDEQFGWLIGALCGDGWASPGKHVCFANVREALCDNFKSIVRGLFSKNDGPAIIGNKGKASWGRSLKHVVSSVAMANMVEDLIGLGAEKKHLPRFFLNSPKEFRIGIFAGLMDTDGSISISRAVSKNKPQLMASYTSNSFRLVSEMLLLARSIGVNGSVTQSKTPKGLDHWILMFNNKTIRNTWEGRGSKHNDHMRALMSFDRVSQTSSADRHDIVPVSFSLAVDIFKAVGFKKTNSGPKKSCYAIFGKAKKTGYVSRSSAINCVNFCDAEKIKSNPDWAEWRRMVGNTKITWDQVVSVEKTSIKETGYDLTVPGHETFMNVEGIVLSNTMVVHVPVTKEGIEEAWKMLPTKHLKNPGNKALMLVPSMEAVMGLFMLTKKGKTRSKNYKSMMAARKDLKEGKLKITDTVTIEGKKTSLGRFMVNMILPASLRDYDREINKKSLKVILEKVYENHRSEYGKIADGLKELGNKHAYYGGFTVSLKDLTPIKKDRDRLLRMAAIAIEALADQKGMTKSTLNKKKVEIYTKVNDDLEDILHKKLKGTGNAFYEMMRSGSKGNMTQVRSILAAPMLKTNTDGSTIPMPVTKSYAEGLTTSDMWIDAYGARKGVIDKVSETSAPGDMAKMLAGAGMDYIVSVHDCNTTKGVMVRTDDKEIIDRYSAETIAGVVKRNDPVTGNVVSGLKKKKVKLLKVRSSLSCEAPQGVCVMCAGLDENGEPYKKGDAIGVMAAQAISEPIVQLIMRTFHTGGSASGANSTVGAFDRLEQIVKMPETLPSKATLSSISGKIDRIAKSPIGGMNVSVSGTDHHIPFGLDPNVKIGDSVKKGDTLSSGVIKPQELLQYKGMPAVQKYMADSIHDLYKDGSNVRRSVIEHIIKAITSLTKVIDPGKTGYIPGDITSFNKVQNVNSGLDKKDRAIHEPILKGITTMPAAITAHKDADWMGMMGFKYLKKTIQEGASQGWTSDIHGNHPVPGLVYANEFGKGEDGGY